MFATGHPFINMEYDDITFHWKIRRKDAEVKFGISLNYNEFNNKVEVAGITDKSLAGEKNRCLNTFPSTSSFVLKIRRYH